MTENSAAGSHESRTLLALERTRLAADRTLMAWIRTAFSMITFGFAVVKFFEALHGDAATAGERLITPRMLGLTLIGLGTAALLAGAWEYWQLLERLRAMGVAQRASVAALGVAILVGIFAVLAFVGVLLPSGLG
jgi:putative membrane protein